MFERPNRSSSTFTFYIYNHDPAPHSPKRRIEDAETTLKVTPFEKNMEVWRQLWRVVERSDLVIQIVDARHPLMFRFGRVGSSNISVSLRPRLGLCV
jgi:hypothetical protein